MILRFFGDRDAVLRLKDLKERLLKAKFDLKGGFDDIEEVV